MSMYRKELHVSCVSLVILCSRIKSVEILPATGKGIIWSCLHTHEQAVYLESTLYLLGHTRRTCTYTTRV